MRKLLFPPIVPSSLPAFSKRDTLRYYFKPSIANSMSQIKHMQMTIVRFDTNLSIIKNPFEILFFNKGDIREDIGKGFWFVDVSADIFPKSDTPYKIQIRLGEIDIEGMIDTQFGTVLKDLDKMSEWSIVTNVMPITVPDFGIQSLDTSVENKIFSTGNVFTGFYIAKDELKKETISSYQYNLYTYESFNDKKTWKLLSTSGEKYVGAETNISLSYSFPIELIEKSRYIVTMTIKSRNLFVETKIYRVYTDTNPSLEMFNTVYVKPNSEEGLMDISIISKQILMKPSDKTSKITYVLDEPGYESYPSLKGTHAIVDGKYYADDNVLMIEKNGVWICQLKTMFPIVHNNLSEVAKAPTIELYQNTTFSSSSEYFTKIKVGCYKINLAYPTTGNLNPTPEWQYRFVVRKEILVKVRGVERVVSTQNKTIKQVGVIDPKQEFYFYIKENNGLLEVDIRKTYLSKK